MPIIHGHLRKSSSDYRSIENIKAFKGTIPDIKQDLGYNTVIINRQSDLANFIERVTYKLNSNELRIDNVVIKNEESLSDIEDIDE